MSTATGPHGQRVARNATAIFIGQVIGLTVRLLTFVAVARYVGVSRYGDLTYLVALVAVLEVVGDMGLRITVVQRGARRLVRLPTTIGHALIAKIPLALLVLLTSLAVVPLTGSMGLLIAGLVGCTAITQLASDPGVWRARAHERMVFEAVATAAERVLFAVLVAGVILSGLEWWWVLVALLSANVIRLVVCGIWGRRRFGPLQFSYSRRASQALLWEAAPLGIALLLSIIFYRSGIFLLTWLRGSEDVGLFGTAFTFFQPMLFLPASVVVALLPPLARAAHRSPDAFRTLFRLFGKAFLLLALPLGAELWILADPIIDLSFGQQFAAAATDLRVLSLAIPVLFINFLIRFTLASMRLQRLDLVAMILGLSINLILGVLLIPRLGHLGAAIALVAAEGTMLGTKLLAVRSLLQGASLLSLLPVGASTALMIVAMLLSYRISPWLAAVAGVITYPLALVVFRGFTREDIRAIQRALADAA